MKKSRFRTKWFSWIYTLLAITGLFWSAFFIYPYLENLKGEHNNPSCPDLVYHSMWFVAALIVFPILYSWTAIVIWYVSIQTIEGHLSLKKFATLLRSNWEWWAIPLGVICIGAILVFLLWLFSTQFWVWVLVLTPGAILGAIYGKRRLW